MPQTITVAALAVGLLATGSTAVVVAKPKPNAHERELEKRTNAALRYFCNTPHHDAAFYDAFVDAMRMSVWNFEGGISPYTEALANVAQDAGSGGEDFLGTAPMGMTDTMRTRTCTDRRDQFDEAVDRITEKKKIGLKEKYQNNEAAIKAFPTEKVEAVEKAIADEKARAQKSGN